MPHTLMTALVTSPGLVIGVRFLTSPHALRRARIAACFILAIYAFGVVTTAIGF